MSNYTKRSFDLCQFNPMVEEKMLDAHPKLNEIIDPSWVEDPWLDRIIRYMIMVYDPSSPLFKGERDLNYRRRMAFDLVGIDGSMLEDYETLIKAICSHTHAYLHTLIPRYLARFPKSKEWAAIMATEFCFWEGCQKLLEPIIGDTSKAQLEAVQKKGMIKDELDKDIKRLDSYYKIFFGGDEELEKIFKKRGTTPELMSRNV